MTAKNQNKGKQQKQKQPQNASEDFDVTVTETPVEEEASASQIQDPGEQQEVVETPVTETVEEEISEKPKDAGKSRKKQEKEAANQFFENTTETTSEGRKAPKKMVEYNAPVREVEIEVYRYRDDLDEDGNTKGHLPRVILDKARKPISSVYKRGGAIVRGIDRTEAEALLPEVIDESPGTIAYDQAVKNYFINKSLEVDPHGSTIRVGKDKYGKVVPLYEDPESYITYRWLMDHPQVSLNKNDAARNPLIHYYMVDPDEREQSKRKKNRIKKDALLKYHEVREDEEMVDATLKSFPEFVTPVQVYNMSEEDKDDKLFEIQESKPQQFVELVENEDVVIFAELEEMVAAGVLEREGTRYTYLSDPIGSSKEKAAAYLKDPENLGLVQQLRRKLEEYKRTHK